MNIFVVDCRVSLALCQVAECRLACCQCHSLQIGHSNNKLINRWDSKRELFATTSYTYYEYEMPVQQDVQLSQRERAVRCVRILAKSGRL